MNDQLVSRLKNSMNESVAKSTSVMNEILCIIKYLKKNEPGNVRRDLFNLFLRRYTRGIDFIIRLDGVWERIF